MDFPLQLIGNSREDLEVPVFLENAGSNLEFVYSMDELRNDLYLLLKTVQGSFLQNIDLGTTAVPHSVEEIYVESAVKRCCEQIDGCSCESVGYRDGFLIVRVIYMGDISEFEFSVEAL